MKTGAIKIDPGLIALIEGKGGALPGFARELVVLECHVAGTSYLDLEKTEPTLNKDDRFLLIRESKNEYDPFAVAIYSSKKEKLGYLPRAKNETIARLLDHGKTIFAVLKSKEWVDEWLKMELVVWMLEG